MATSSGNNSKDTEFQGQKSDFPGRHKLEATSVPENVKGNENKKDSEDQETTELHSRASAQEKELGDLRKQIALASIKESQLLNEKYELQRKFAELRMALDEKQSEVITSQSNELARRKGDLEVNVNLLNELKVAEDEKHIFTSSMLAILSENGALPHVTNASALTNSIKHLHDQMQLKIRTSHARLADLNSMIGSNSRNSFLNKEIPSSNPMSSQVPSSSVSASGYTSYNNYIDRKNPEQANDLTRYVQDNDPKQVIDNRNVASNIGDNTLQRSGFMSTSEQAANQFSHPQMMHDGVDSFGPDDPGIENFQIIGEAKPGCKLLGCGYPVRGTSLCMFQWVRHYPDGTRQDIEGATNPDYIVTADDVDRLVAVECIPMDEQGRQGELVRVFANDNNKITCDEDMQDEIDTYISRGLASFSVQILLDSFENFEQATVSLRRSGFQVKVDRTQEVLISEKYSNELLIKIPNGLSPQFVLTCSNGSSYPISTSNDIRMRDTLVLTLRIFQSKALDEKRKGKA